MKRLLAVGTALLFGSLALLPSQAQSTPRIDRVYVFGDSYSDIGEGYLDGNGPTAVAYFAEKLGTKLYPANIADVSGKSLDYAVSGAQTGSGEGRRLKGFLLGYGMRRQVDDFAAQVKSGEISFNPKTTLFYLAGGLNDHRLTTDVTVANLGGEIKTLYELGARRFEVALLPIAIPGFAETGNRLNPALAKIPAELTPQLPEAEIRSSHWGPFFDEVMHHPAPYGIANTTDACAGREIRDENTTPCAHPETYFYYHAEHPSTATHKAVGEMLYQEWIKQQVAR
jgi:phospholipase/lecithinase/hemolysin